MSTRTILQRQGGSLERPPVRSHWHRAAANAAHRTLADVPRGRRHGGDSGQRRHAVGVPAVRRPGPRRSDGRRRADKGPTIFNDSATATIRSVEKNPSATDNADQRHHADALSRRLPPHRRPRTPGVDVPYGFDGGLGITVTPGSSIDVAFEIVRHQAKLEPPLKNLAGQGGLGFHLDDRRDHFLWPRPERQRSLSHGTDGRAVWRFRRQIGRSGRTIMRTTTFVTLLGAAASRPSPGASRMSTSPHWRGRRPSRIRSSWSPTATR